MSKVMVSVIMFVLIAAASCSSVNKKSMSGQFKNNAAVGIMISPRSLFVELLSIRKFIKAGYRVKALNIIKATRLYPGLAAIFMRSGNLGASIKHLHKMALMSELNRDIAQQKELGQLKTELGIDYLVYITHSVNTFNALAIDLEKREIIYSHTFSPSGCMATDNYPGDTKIEKAINLFVRTIKRR